MNKKFKQISTSLLFCLIFIMYFSGFVNVFAADVNTEFDTGKKLVNGTTFETIISKIRSSVYETFMVSAGEGYINGTDVIPSYTFDKGNTNSTPIYDASGTDFLDGMEPNDNEKVTLTFTIKLKDGTETKYNIVTYYKKYDCGKKHTETRNGKVEFFDCPGHSKSTGSDEQKKQYVKAQECQALISDCAEGVKQAVTACGISAGYNVGTAYSTNQKALYDIMEEKNGYYDFKRMKSVDFTLSYFYSPVFGKIEIADLPKDDDEWLGKFDASVHVSGTTVNLDQGFIAMNNELDPTGQQINDRGERITDSVSFSNGVKSFGKFSGVSAPKGVISYNMRLAVPYIFDLGANGRGYLLTTDLHVLEEYTYNIYNERIYNSNNEEVTTMPAVDISRTQLYLYNQQYTDPTTNATSLIGVVIVAYFDEAIMDTTVEDPTNNPNNEPLLYLTGRRIGFTNGYSDKLDFMNRNVNLMFVTSTAGKEGYLPACVAFPMDTESLMGFGFENALSFRVAGAEPEIVKALDELTRVPTTDEMLQYTLNDDNHAKLPQHPDAVKMFIDFGFVSIKSDTVVNGTAPTPAAPSGGSGGTGTTPSTSPTTGNEEGKYAFYIIRNNRYYDVDEDLLDWLRSDLAQSMTYVDADTLILKITGDFTDNLGKITYAEYQRMEEIRRELQYDKDMWLIRTLNVTSLVLGVSLIIFAILLIMFYWFDQFNAFTSFSLIQFVSMGNLYPVWDKDIIPYVPMNSDKVKFVTFKDILIMAFIMVVLGILFVNTLSVVEFIISIYNYIMFILGGAK